MPAGGAQPRRGASARVPQHPSLGDGGRAERSAAQGPVSAGARPHRAASPRRHRQLHGAAAGSRVTCAGRNPGEGVSLPGEGGGGRRGCRP